METTASKASVSRRSAITGLGAAGLGAALVARGVGAAAQDATAVSTAGHPLVGTWVVHFEDPAQAPAIAVWAADGSFIDAGNGLCGVWEVTGPRTALHTWVKVVAGNGGSYIVVSGTITVDASGESWTQPYSTMVVSASGAVLNTGHGAVHATRLRPVPEDQIGTPLATVSTWTPATPTAGTPTS